MIALFGVGKEDFHVVNLCACEDFAISNGSLDLSESFTATKEWILTLEGSLNIPSEVVFI